jgi:cytochrome c peroxidase
MAIVTNGKFVAADAGSLGHPLDDTVHRCQTSPPDHAAIALAVGGALSGIMVHGGRNDRATARPGEPKFRGRRRPRTHNSNPATACRRSAKVCTWKAPVCRSSPVPRRGLACSSCHDLHTNGADDSRRTTARDGSKLPFTVLTVFNAALSFRLNWEGNFRTLEAQAQLSLENPANMATSVDEVLTKLNADSEVVRQFRDAYGRPPDKTSLLDAIATYERSLVTPGSRFDRRLGGDSAALTAEEQTGYGLFKSLGCVSCHQGVNIGSNLFERHGIFRPLGSPLPEMLRVPSLRNVATMAPYFHDGSSSTLNDTVRKMADAQLDRTLSDQQIATIVAFLKTLTGTFDGAPVVAPPP